jgi:hypothetical protein
MRLILLVACLVLAVQSAHAAGRLAEVLVIDRDSGVPLRTYYHRGEYRVAGNPGARYAIEIRNTLHERVLAVTSPPAANDFSWRISAAASVIVAGFCDSTRVAFACTHARRPMSKPHAPRHWMQLRLLAAA